MPAPEMYFLISLRKHTLSGRDGIHNSQRPTSPFFFASRQFSVIFLAFISSHPTLHACGSSLLEHHVAKRWSRLYIEDVLTFS